MSNAYTLRQKRAGGQDQAVGRFVTIGAIVLAAGLLAYVLARFLILPMMTIRHLVVESDISFTEKEVWALAGLRGDERFAGLDTAAVERRLEAAPLVQSARVEKVFPDTLKLVIYRRQAVALMVGRINARNVPVLVDGQGVAFALAKTAAEVDLPVISGVTVGEVALGTPLPSAYAAFFADLASLKSKYPAMFRIISEVRIVSNAPAAASAPPSGAAVTSSAAGSLEFLLYLVNSPVAIRAVGPLDNALIKSCLAVLGVLSNKGVLRDIEELDLRGTDAVYRTKEE